MLVGRGVSLSEMGVEAPGPSDPIPSCRDRSEGEFNQVRTTGRKRSYMTWAGRNFEKI